MNGTEKILVFFGLIIAAALAAALVFEFGIGARVQKGTITILRGQNALQIANDLKAEGYISSKIVFLFQVIYGGNLKNLKAGVYDFRGLGEAEIINELVLGKSVAEVLTVTPGEELGDIAAALPKFGVGSEDFLNYAHNSSLYVSEFDFLKDLPKNASLEGYLFPDSYQVPEKPTSRAIVKIMLENFGKKLTPEFRAQIDNQKKSIFDVVTMASMIEKEVITLEDKKIVSGLL